MKSSHASTDFKTNNSNLNIEHLKENEYMEWNQIPNGIQGL